MTLSTAIYEAHQKLKVFNSDLTRVQVYELAAALNGYKSFKFLCADTLTLNCDFKSTCRIHQERFKELCDKFNLSSVATQTSEIIIGSLSSYQVIFLTTDEVIDRISYKENLQELKEQTIYQAIEDSISLNKPSYNALICKLMALNSIMTLHLDYDRGEVYRLYQQHLRGMAIPDVFKSDLDDYISNLDDSMNVRKELIDTLYKAIKLFGFERMSWFLYESEIDLEDINISVELSEIEYHAALSGSNLAIEAIFDNLYEKFEDNQSNSDLLIELWSWAIFADEIGFSELLHGNLHAINSKGETIYETWEYADFAGTDGREPIYYYLPELSEIDLNKAKEIVVTKMAFYKQ
ncbi:hypothetical protein [Entomomonas asaccharolytica]|uniref:Uncharacterized protein n=1 Tax=Entomomonas asaccharolytica TaxID=2785331 RepID=A0A974NFI4_9GAMM|nr:hypothetical protein [Entomomonas asaccharolytica]QQP85738.1 hypothetical protein JHT90_00285 [Entomomonas asaccharolytica]